MFDSAQSRGGSRNGRGESILNALRSQFEVSNSDSVEGQYYYRKEGIEVMVILPR